MHIREVVLIMMYWPTAIDTIGCTIIIGVREFPHTLLCLPIDNGMFNNPFVRMVRVV